MESTEAAFESTAVESGIRLANTLQESLKASHSTGV